MRHGRVRFATSNCGDDSLAEDEHTEKHHCENYTEVIVTWFENKKKKCDYVDEEQHKKPEDN